MDHLSAAQLRELREQMQNERVALRAQLQGHEQDAKAEERRVETQDAASQEEMRTTAVASAQRSRARLADLDAALTRIEKGEYGVCEESDEEIPFARLRAEPTARYTVEGLESLERDEKTPRDTSHNPGAY